MANEQPVNIKDLIPHRAPFLFLDGLLSVSREEITGHYTFLSAASIFKNKTGEHDFVPGIIVVESMAQCGGAGVKFLGITNGLFGLASIDGVKFLANVEYDKQVHYVVKNLRLGEKIVKQSGIAYVDGIAVVEASWMCIRIGE